RIAGEWGHIPLPWPRDDERPGPACYCGKFGCIETWLSGPGLSGQYFLRSGICLPASELASASRAGDVIAQRCLRDYEDRLARGLSVIVNVFDPDTIVLGGGLSNLADLYNALPALMTRYVLSGEVQTRVVRAVHGDSSGVRGAAMLWPLLKNVEERAP
ncbi:MAG: ROK family protein, partial [Candidatus Eremiobacteraeota bacterium]|nr:ROK family protein [Candidatus Eremiobacteraeota bacterium]